MKRTIGSLALALLLLCGGFSSALAQTVDLSVLATTDLHGQLEPHTLRGKQVGGIQWLGAYLDAARSENPQGTVLVDAGDLFQGTLLSNHHEGAPVIDAYNAIGYDAVALGNHEFDFGPVGPSLDGGDPFGALKARLRQATFPFLGANVYGKTRGRRVRWPNTRSTWVVERKGIKVGIVGLATIETHKTGSPRYLGGVEIRPLAKIARRLARGLRTRGCKVIVVAAHAGGFMRGGVLEGEIAEFANAMPPGLVDVIIGGHTHREVATEVNGIPVSIPYCKGRAIGRIDLKVDPEQGVVGWEIEKIRVRNPEPSGTWPQYHGKDVLPRNDLLDLLQPYQDDVDALTGRIVGYCPDGIRHNPQGDSPLGSLINDAMLAATPDADFALLNPFSIRKRIFAGPVTFGDLYDVFPIDNTVFAMDLSGADLRAALEEGVSGQMGIVSLGGLRVVFDPDAPVGERIVTLEQADGSPILDGATYRVVTTDFLAAGGDGYASLLLGQQRQDTLKLVRDALVDYVRERSGLAPDEVVSDASTLTPLYGAPARVRRGSFPSVAPVPPVASSPASGLVGALGN